MSKPEALCSLMCTKQSQEDSREALAVVWLEVTRAWTWPWKGRESKRWKRRSSPEHSVWMLDGLCSLFKHLNQQSLFHHLVIGINQWRQVWELLSSYKSSSLCSCWIQAWLVDPKEHSYYSYYQWPWRPNPEGLWETGLSLLSMLRWEMVQLYTVIVLRLPKR